MWYGSSLSGSSSGLGLGKHSDMSLKNSRPISVFNYCVAERGVIPSYVAGAASSVGLVLLGRVGGGWGVVLKGIVISTIFKGLLVRRDRSIKNLLTGRKQRKAFVYTWRDVFKN